MNHFDNGDSTNSVGMALVTMFLYILTTLTVQDWAGVAAILAGVSTAAFNGYKFIKLLKNKKK